MKKLFFFSIVMFLSCRKNSDKPSERNLSLAGKWILSESLAGPGDGSGKWTAVDKPIFILYNSIPIKLLKRIIIVRLKIT